MDILCVDEFDLPLFLNAGDDVLQVSNKVSSLRVEVVGTEGTTLSEIPAGVAANFTLVNFENGSRHKKIAEVPIGAAP